MLISGIASGVKGLEAVEGIDKKQYKHIDGNTLMVMVYVSQKVDIATKQELLAQLVV